MKAEGVGGKVGRDGGGGCEQHKKNCRPTNQANLKNRLEINVFGMELGQ